MPKFRVTSNDPQGSSRQSIDYPSEQAASDDAQRSLADMAKDALPDGKRAHFKVRVEDQAGEEVYCGSLDFQGHGREKREGRDTTES
ncbi:hypothetical protein ASE66_23060 [Bosea sp. Root483D1]|uniref:DUF6894 family protein n=1 Tax=Bosea sp. Root483D1 TaxID=1736544 RepID=UPI00070BCE39|nr:hypothetical protein [Bosea sp. Root483D1]KRE11445.1 hypothetical protein ASE66_23060 [Bosea sp. Root483D1]